MLSSRRVIKNSGSVPIVTKAQKPEATSAAASGSTALPCVRRVLDNHSANSNAADAAIRCSKPTAKGHSPLMSGWASARAFWP